jgi:ParB-like chromosome segregation protein Spo0J
MVFGMKSQKLVKGALNAMMPLRIETFSKSMAAMKRAELGAIETAARQPETIVAITPKGIGVRADGGFVRQAEGEVVTPDGAVITQDGKFRTIAAGGCGELEGGEYGIIGKDVNAKRRFGEDMTENACALVTLAEEGLVETRKVPLTELAGEAKAGENGIQLRADRDGNLKPVSDMPENERRKPVVVLEREDGTFELVTGRKRVAAAKVAGNGEIEAVVIREKDGWTSETAKVVDIVDNLMKGSPVTDAEAVSAANALDIGYDRAQKWGLAANGNVAAAFRLREKATRELMSLTDNGAISLETADAIARNANRRNMPGAASDDQIADIQLELAKKLKGRSAEEVDAVCRKLRERDMAEEEAYDPMTREKLLNDAIAAAERERLEEAAKKSAQRTFQALRIDVNSEFEVLYAFLEKLPSVLKAGGRVAILTFHSGEDRLVKKAFQTFNRMGIYSEVARDVIRPSAEECVRNSRAKSTKMRWAIRSDLEE